MVVVNCEKESGVVIYDMVIIYVYLCANKIIYEGFVGSSSSGLYLDDILPNQMIYDKEVETFSKIIFITI